MKALIGLFLICLPLKNFKINSTYGFRLHPLTDKYAMHFGLDLKACSDTVYAIMDGTVIHAEYSFSLGSHICLGHGELQSVYGHLSQVWVSPKDSVFAGEPIGITGATGRVTGEHLHFSLRYRQRYINPLKFFYELLNNQQNERKIQTRTGPAVGKAGR